MKPILLSAILFTLASVAIAQKTQDPNARHLRAVKPSASVAPRHHAHAAVELTKPVGVDAQLNQLEHQTATLVTAKPERKTPSARTTPKTNGSSDGNPKIEFKYQPPKSSLTTTQSGQGANKAKSGIRGRVNGAGHY